MILNSMFLSQERTQTKAQQKAQTQSKEDEKDGKKGIDVIFRVRVMKYDEML